MVKRSNVLEVINCFLPQIPEFISFLLFRCLIVLLCDFAVILNIFFSISRFMVVTK